MMAGLEPASVAVPTALTPGGNARGAAPTAQTAPAGAPVAVKRAMLVLYAGYDYVNPSFPLLLARYASGAVPGVTALDVTTASPESVSGALQRADVAVVDQSLVNAATWSDLNQSLYYHIAHPRPTAHYADVLERVRSAAVARALLANSDLHDPRDLEFYRSNAHWFDALFWMFEKRPGPLSDIPAAYRDAWLDRYREPAEQWAEVTSLFPVRVESWFSVAEAELRGAARQLWDACVPGASYRTRAIARQSFRAAGLRDAPFSEVGRGMQAATTLLSRVTRNGTVSRAVIRTHQKYQQQVVTRSKVSFVCGSCLRYPVRKYLEIPASGSALIAYPCNGFEDLGFRDGLNCVTAPPEDVGTAARALLRHEGMRTRLAAAAIETVRRMHTVPVRALQIAASLERLAAGTLHGAQFVDGRFEIY